MDLIVFGFNGWQQWEQEGFRTRSAITTLKLSELPETGRVLVVSSASSVWMNALRVAGSAVGRTPRRGTTLKSCNVRRVAEKVWALDHSRLIPREDSWSVGYRLNGTVHDRALRRNIIAAAVELDMRDVVLWMANPLMAKHIDGLEERLSVFDAIDDWSVHPQKSWMKKPILEGYELVRQRADIVFTVSRDLADRLGRGRGNVKWVPNGVDVERFEGDRAVPPELQGLAGPVIGYVGTLQERIDEEMLLAVATRMPNASMVLVGPLVAPSHFLRIRGMPNVRFVGAQPGENVPAFINSFDVCILPHVDDAFTRSMDPMKLYEYLAAGKPVVVSGPVQESVRGLIYHAADPDQFASAVEEAAREDDPGLVARRQSFARSRSWDSVVAEMLAVVRPMLAPTGVRHTVSA